MSQIANAMLVDLAVSAQMPARARLSKGLLASMRFRDFSARSEDRRNTVPPPNVAFSFSGIQHVDPIENGTPERHLRLHGVPSIIESIVEASVPGGTVPSRDIHLVASGPGTVDFIYVEKGATRATVSVETPARRFIAEHPTAWPTALGAINMLSGYFGMDLHLKAEICEDAGDTLLFLTLVVSGSMSDALDKYYAFLEEWSESAHAVGHPVIVDLDVVG